MLFDNIRLKLGYSEMYELAEIPKKRNDILARFMQFSKENPGKIEIANDQNCIIGISTTNSSFTSDNPEYWWKTYKFNEYGDIFIEKKTIATGIKEYNSILEKSYIRTMPKEIIVPIKNDNIDTAQKYIERSDRLEWIRVTLIGKVIVIDDGEVVPGDYCKLYDGDNEELFGTAMKATEDDVKSPCIHTYYVLERFSKNTIMILYK